jgi:hypothetical protein
MISWAAAWPTFSQTHLVTLKEVHMGQQAEAEKKWREKRFERTNEKTVAKNGGNESVNTEGNCNGITNILKLRIHKIHGSWHPIFPSYGRDPSLSTL